MQHYDAVWGDQMGNKLTKSPGEKDDNFCGESLKAGNHLLIGREKYSQFWCKERRERTHWIR